MDLEIYLWAQLMTAEKTEEETAGFPSYPAMMIDAQLNTPGMHALCSCGHVFEFSYHSGTNMVMIQDGEWKRVCPKCYVVAGQNINEHATALTEVHLWLTALQVQEVAKTDGFTGWIRSQQVRVRELLDHVMELGRKISSGDQAICDVLTGSVPAPAIAEKVKWQDCGPFPMSIREINPRNTTG